MRFPFPFRLKSIFTIRSCTLAVIVTIGIVAYAYVAYRGFWPTPEPEPIPVDTTIIGPNAAQAGDLIVLTTDKMGVDYYAWDVVSNGGRRCGGRALENGKTFVIVFKSAGKFTVILATSNSSGVAIAKHTITVTGDAGPEPGPDPEPQPEPNPDSDWVQWTYEIAIATVTSPNRASQAAVLAGQFRSVAAKIAAGAIRTTKEARVGLRVATNRALGKDASGWAAFSVKFADHCIELERSGGLKTLKQYQEIYTVSALGLDKVATEKQAVQPKCINGSCV